MNSIKSPLAKINKVNGSITCILCNAPVKSAKVWVAHVNGRQHRQSLASKKAQLSGTSTDSTNSGKKRPAVDCEIQSKLSKKENTEETPLPKKPRTTETGPLPSDFFDTSQKPSVSIAELKSDVEAPKSIANKEKLDSAASSSRDLSSSSSNADASTSSGMTPWEKELVDKQTALEVKPPEPNTAEALPEGFFDDKQIDAKIRKVEIKDEMEEEWAKFQKEIKVAEQMSNAIIEEEEEAMTTEREIEEIDKQIEEWKRVNELEKKKDEVEILRKKMAEEEAKKVEDMETEEDDEDIDLDSILDWRSKGIR